MHQLLQLRLPIVSGTPFTAFEPVQERKQQLLSAWSRPLIPILPSRRRRPWPSQPSILLANPALRYTVIPAALCFAWKCFQTPHNEFCAETSFLCVHACRRQRLRLQLGLSALCLELAPCLRYRLSPLPRQLHLQQQKVRAPHLVAISPGKPYHLISHSFWCQFFICDAQDQTTLADEGLPSHNTLTMTSRADFSLHCLGILRQRIAAPLLLHKLFAFPLHGMACSLHHGPSCCTTHVKSSQVRLHVIAAMDGVPLANRCRTLSKGISSGGSSNFLLQAH